MVVFPNCKINLGLNILRRRPDGFHDISSVFIPLPIYDALEIIPASGSETTFEMTGVTKGISSENICLKAYQLIQKDFPHLPALKIHLHKTLPAGAGLGGGSSNATYMLSLLKKQFDLDITPAKMEAYALKLGSDCPFFLNNEWALASGKGEIRKPLPNYLPGKKILVLHPGLNIRTAAIFEEVVPRLPQKTIIDILEQDIATWKNELKNDFEEIVFPKYPLLKEIKQNLYDLGALYASMTGTGSALYGIFNGKAEEIILHNPAFFQKWVTL